MKKNKMFLKAKTLNITKIKESQKQKIENLNMISKKRMDDVIYFLSEDIRQYQQLLKLLGPHHKNVELLNDKIYSELSENNFEIIQFILGKKKRTNEELNIIKTFLSTMKYLSSMIKLIDTDKILFSLSVYLKMESKSKDSILFRFGNRGTKFYILLVGIVTILLLKETKVKMSFPRFFLHLLLLKMMKEDELVKKTIIANYKNKYHLDERTFDVFYEKLVKFANKHFGKNLKKNLNEEDSFSNEDSENESEKEIKKNKNKNKNNENENENENNEEIPIKKVKTLQLNYLCSNYNEKITTDGYKFEINETIRAYQKVEEIKSNSNVRRSITFSSSYKLGLIEASKLASLTQKDFSEMEFPIFEKEEEIREILSYYLHLKESLVEVRKNKISCKDYIRDTYINSIYSQDLKEDESIEKENYSIYLYHEIVQKKNGDTFGELALQHEDSKRTATIVTNTDVILGYLSKNDYETCLSEIELKRRKNEVNFIMSFSIFDQMNWISFENKYFNYFKREFYNQGERILRQGERISKIFFIMDGQFEITSSISISTLYKIIKQKTNNSIQNIKINTQKKINNIRLCICNNKDIIGLSDSCFYGVMGDQISFINATCISNKSVAFTLDKTILNDLTKRMSEINENLKKIGNKREEVMIDRLISIYKQFLKNKREKMKFYYSQSNNYNKKNNMKTINNNSTISNIQRSRVMSANQKGEIISPNRHMILSAKYREISPLSKISKDRNIIDHRNDIFPHENQTQYRKAFSSKKYKLKININDLEENKNNYNLKESENNIEYKKKITNIMAVKENIPPKLNPRIYLKSAVTIRELNEKTNVREKMKNLYLPLNNIIHKEYNNLFNWIDYNNKLLESHKKIIEDESECKKENINNEEIKKRDSEIDDSKKLSFSSDNEGEKNDKVDKDDIKYNRNNYKNEESNNNSNNMINPNALKKNKNLKIRRTLKNLEMEEEMRKKLINDLKKKKKEKNNPKNIKLYSKSINNKYINNCLKKYSNTDYDRIPINKISLIKHPIIWSKNKNNLKIRVKNTESYLKQILGTRYRNQEDEFISRTEKRLIKEINDYNADIKRKNEIRLKFAKKRKKKNKNNAGSRYSKTDLNNENSDNSDNDNDDLMTSNNFNVKNLKRSYAH